MLAKAIVMDEAAVERALTRMAHEILEKNKGTEKLVLVGVRRRGVPLARMIAAQMEKIEGCAVPVCEVDITQYRDDLDDDEKYKGEMQKMDVNLEGMNCVLVDDVLYTGRTTRAAMDAIIANGRPRQIRLAVLIDRGHRELPIHADFVGKNVPTSQTEAIGVRVPEFDACLDVMLYETQPGRFSDANPMIV